MTKWQCEPVDPAAPNGCCGKCKERGMERACDGKQLPPEKRRKLLETITSMKVHEDLATFRTDVFSRLNKMESKLVELDKNYQELGSYFSTSSSEIALK